MKNTSTESQLGVVSILGFIFITLKLMGYIDWSWWIVTLPFWGGISLILIISIIAIIYYYFKNKLKI